MEATEFVYLAETIYEFCGIDYRKSLSSLKTKVSGRLNDLGLSCWEYSGYLRAEPIEWDHLIELITVNETYFFREENLLDEFKTIILPKKACHTPENPLQIWCAACSSGEEPYTIGMLVEESGLFHSGSVHIVATDINKKVLEKAKMGLYNKKSFSFRKMPEGAYDKFFDDQGENYQVKEGIRNMVEFRHMNLLDKSLPSKMEKFDLIICRNVLIYFDRKVIQELINHFQSMLKQNGFLFLGHSESLSHYDHDLESIYTDRIFYYRKGE